MSLRLSFVVAAAIAAVTLTACGDASQEVGAGSEPTADPLPPPAAGYTWLSWHDVAVQVPEDWGPGYEPRSDWCTRSGDAPDPRPYYALDPSSGAVLDILCAEPSEHHPPAFGEAPESMWAPHVVLERATDEPDTAVSDDGWTMSARTIGDVRVRVLSHGADAHAILDSARRFTVDAHGCEPTSPAQAAEFVRPAPFDVTTVKSADSISICQYARTARPDEPALTGSRQVGGQQAARLLAGLQDAPVGTGPDRPKNCVDDEYGETAIAIRVHHDRTTDDVYAYYDWCFGNGTDDGTHHRQLTAQTCAPLFAAPVRLLSYSSFLRDICDSET